MNVSPFITQTDVEIAACFPVMLELRPHLVEAAFVDRIRRQMATGYRLAGLRAGVSKEVVCCAGYRFLENLAWGRFLYVDDLVTAKNAQGAGYGSVMLQWLEQTARDNGCEQFHLDSGTARLGAHRFYHKHELAITSFHFARKLS